MMKQLNAIPLNSYPKLTSESQAFHPSITRAGGSITCDTCRRKAEAYHEVIEIQSLFFLQEWVSRVLNQK